MKTKPNSKRRDAAAALLDQTLALDNRGPRTAKARALVAAWLDGRLVDSSDATIPGDVAAAIRWLRVVVEESAGERRAS